MRYLLLVFSLTLACAYSPIELERHDFSALSNGDSDSSSNGDAVYYNDQDPGDTVNCANIGCGMPAVCGQCGEACGCCYCSESVCLGAGNGKSYVYNCAAAQGCYEPQQCSQACVYQKPGQPQCLENLRSCSSVEDAIITLDRPSNRWCDSHDDCAFYSRPCEFGCGYLILNKEAGELFSPLLNRYQAMHCDAGTVCACADFAPTGVHCDQNECKAGAILQ